MKKHISNFHWHSRWGGVIGSILLLSGASCVSYRPVTNYDLLPVPIKNDYPAHWQLSVSNLTAVSGKMQFRKDLQQLLIDDYNRWVQSPDQMLRRYLQLKLASVPGSGKIRIAILEWDFDLSTREARLALELQLDGKETEVLAESAFLSEGVEANAENFAGAMGRAAEAMAEKIAGHLREVR